MLATTISELLQSPFLIVALVIGFYMAWNIGANDVANAMGTSVGSKALTFMAAVILAGIFEFLGAVLVGAQVTDTVRKGIVSFDQEQISGHQMHLVYGMTAAMIAAAVWLNFATYFGQPVSTTHSIVGGIFGFGCVAQFQDIGASVGWGTMGKIVASWFISPVVSGLIAFAMFRLIQAVILRKHDPHRAARRWSPFFVFLVGIILVLSFIFKGMKNRKDLVDKFINIDQVGDFVESSGLGNYMSALDAVALATSVAIGLIGAAAGGFIVYRISAQVIVDPTDKLAFVERIFAFLQVLTACFVAFAHGANDVANAVGPLAAVYHVLTAGEVSMKVPVPTWILVMGGVGIVTGLAMMGRRVMVTVGSKITEITPTRGFAAEFAAATTVLVCSKLQMPVSTTHALVGAVMGVALARGIAAMDMKTARTIFSAWIITVPVTAGITIVLYLLAVLALPAGMSSM